MRSSMNVSWLETLGHVDTMVLGGIVGSVILTFVLVVVIFSIQIKMQHDRIGHLQAEIAGRDRLIEAEQKLQRQMRRDASDAQRITEHYQQQEETLMKELIGSRKKLEAERKKNDELRLEVKHASEARQELLQTIETLKREKEEAEAEVHAARKRNEFWIAQISELRTKYEALKYKLTFQQGRTA